MKPWNPLNAKKLLLSKWPAVVPVAKQKHFLVSQRGGQNWQLARPPCPVRV